MELDFSKQLQADRSGPKSAAQTPAEKEEKKRGSSVNEPGSAAGAITFSEKVTTSLKNKVKEHNEKSDKKATLGMLKKIYRRGTVECKIDGLDRRLQCPICTIKQNDNLDLVALTLAKSRLQFLNPKKEKPLVK